MLGDRCWDILVTGLVWLGQAWHPWPQWNMQTVSKFSLYVRDLVTFCRTRTEVGQQ